MTEDGQFTIPGLNSVKLSPKVKKVRLKQHLERKMSFQDVRNALVMAYADDLLDDGEFLFLCDNYEPVNPSYPYWDFDPFCSDSFDSCECEAHFGVARDDLTTLLNG